MMKNPVLSVIIAAFGVLVAHSVTAQDVLSPKCAELVALYIEIAEKSGTVVSEAAARAEVLAENPTDSECNAMLELFALMGRE